MQACTELMETLMGVTMVPWSNGRFLVWDATCVDTFCDSHRQATAKEVGGAAAHAETEIAKYAHLERAYQFHQQKSWDQPVVHHLFYSVVLPLQCSSQSDSCSPACTNAVRVVTIRTRPPKVVEEGTCLLKYPAKTRTCSHGTHWC